MKPKLIFLLKHIGGHNPVAIVQGRALSHFFVWEDAYSAHVLRLDPSQHDYDLIREDLLGVTNRSFPIYANIELSLEPKSVLTSPEPTPVPPEPPSVPSSETLAKELKDAPVAPEPNVKAPVIADSVVRLKFTESGLRYMTVEELKALAEARGIEYPKRAREKTLTALHLEWQQANL
jgi:hypothetical protein